MPELPEVEIVRAGLEGFVAGARIDSVQVLRDSCVRLLDGGPAEFAARVGGLTIDSIGRRGKFMWLALSEGGAHTEPLEALSAHLGMSGQFRVHLAAPADAPPPHAHCRARLGLSAPDGAPLTVDFLDQRTFGYLHAEALAPTPDGAAGGAGTPWAAVPQSVAHIARDALDPHLDRAQALAGLRRGARGIKQVLLDQTVVSGIGNIYADEALWRARTHPQRPASAMTPRAAAAVLEAAADVMQEALAQGGTSFDALYVNVNGESGYFSRDLNAYGRGGEPCPRCGAPIHRASVGGRSTHWCSACQRRFAPRRGPGRPGLQA